MLNIVNTEAPEFCSLHHQLDQNDPNQPTAKKRSSPNTFILPFTDQFYRSRPEEKCRLPTSYL